MGVRLGIPDHLGWAVAVTAAPDHAVVGALPAPLVSISLRFWPPDFPGQAAVSAFENEAVATVS